MPQFDLVYNLYPVSIWGDHTWFLEQYGMFQVIAILLIR